VVGVLCALGLSICSFAWGADKQVTIKLANYFAISHPQNIALEKAFKPTLESGSKGSLTVNFYPDNQLGSEKEFIDGIRLGSIQMGIIGIMLGEKYPTMKLGEFPYLFDNVDLGYKILNEHLDELTGDLLKGEGMRALGVTVNGVRAISNSKRPINSPADAKGIKLRIPQVSMYTVMGKALGFNVVTMPYGEIFTALQTGVVDGQENPPTTVLASGWYEVQKYIALTDHCIAYNYVVVNERFYQSLSEENKKALKAAVDAYAALELKLYKEAMQKDIDTLKSKGVAFTTPERKPFKDIVLAAYPEMLGPDPKLNALAKRFLDLQK
jgi:tripartite ATP-independent transporter DctP family solute receptor